MKLTFADHNDNLSMLLIIFVIGSLSGGLQLLAKLNKEMAELPEVTVSLLQQSNNKWALILFQQYMP